MCSVPTRLKFGVAAKALLEVRLKKNLDHKCTRLLLFLTPKSKIAALAPKDMVVPKHVAKRIAGV